MGSPGSTLSPTSTAKGARTAAPRTRLGALLQTIVLVS